MKRSVAEKNGCEVEEASTLVKHILENCKNLEFMGLMTIGQYGYDISKGPNPDFFSLIDCRKNVCQQLGLDTKNVELSMGMSSDFEHAVSEIYFHYSYNNSFIVIILQFYRLNLAVRV